ncbi:unnamed protein product [Bemisia tabaci]|uniref:Uncharacterized protein n=1 Tax=Bemisia tabaci TaxID=7038 RepID=A0A9P0F5Q8_BEMTA|nr:unnamed protein product [Bemisia tabaci]
MFRLSCVKRVKLSESGGKMQNLVRLTLIAACLCAATGTPLPAPSPVARRADRSDQSEAYAASEDHLFNDEGFPLRASARIGDAGSNPDSESRGFAGHRGQYKGYRRPASPVPAELRAGDQPPFNDPFSGFFFDMQDMMKILRDQMSVVLSRVPPKSMNGDDGPLSFVPSDVRNQTTTKVDFVDGHKVVINDTTYSNGDTNSGSIFHVQIVDLLPLDEDGEGPSVGAPSPKQPARPQRPNELDSNNRDVEELEDDDDEIGEDIDEAPKKDVAKEKGKKPAVAPKPKPGDKEQDTGSKGPRAESGKGKEKDVEEVEVVADGVEDEPEGEDIPDLEERKGILLIHVH